MSVSKFWYDNLKFNIFFIDISKNSNRLIEDSTCGAIWLRPGEVFGRIVHPI